MPKIACTLAAIAASLVLAACGPLGKVEQGRVVAYDPQTRQVTLIREATGAEKSVTGVLPAVTVATPTDPNEMGPVPKAGGLMRLDSKNRRIVIYDGAAQAFRTIAYTPIEVRGNVSKSPGPPVVDRVRKTITIYAPKDHALITFAASAELLAMPARTWQPGDVVRYYYKDPAQALRLMNVTANLPKSAG